MELPRRARDDELLRPGEATAIRARLREVAGRHDLVTVIAYAFDHRTRQLPFIGSDLRMAPAGVRGLGAAMVESGFQKTRIVLQQWNPHFKPSEMRLDGRIPDLFLVSTLSLHRERCVEMVADANRIDEKNRPLIVVGGPNSFYRPWTEFQSAPDAPPGADVVVTGEEYVWLSLLELLLSERGEGESMRSAFLRVRDRGLLDEIPGLYYARTDRHGVAQELVDTGIQRLLGNLDELPDPVIGYSLLEPPSGRSRLSAHALPANRVKKYSPISSLVLTFGCKFRCPYCPIPAYNQKQNRAKSPEGIRDEMTRLWQTYGLKYYFGTDDNFFNDEQRTLEIADVLADAMIDGQRLQRRIRWATEATVYDALKLQDHLRHMHAAGLRAIWMGVEDLTATFVKKGQSVDKTTEAFRLLNEAKIHPMPMMMHHDGQPLYTKGSPYGLINQMQILRNAGAITVQVLMMTPAVGSKLYEEAYTKKIAFESVNGIKIVPHLTDANFVIASEDDRPWRKQVNMLVAYVFFYNPLRFLTAVVRPRNFRYFRDLLAQGHGMWGLLYTIRRSLPWIWHLWRGKIVRHEHPPVSAIPIRAADGKRASHALEAQADEGGWLTDLPVAAAPAPGGAMPEAARLDPDAVP